MQTAINLYQSSNESTKKRIALIINVLHSHEALSTSSLIIDTTKKSLSSSDWTITSGLLDGITYNTQLAQKLTLGLYQYAKKNDEMLNASSWKFWHTISNAFMNKTIKQARLLPIYELIDLLESGRNQINDILLFNKIKNIVNDQNWLQGRSSELHDILKEIYEQCESQKILYFKTDIEDNTQTIQTLKRENHELRQVIHSLNQNNAKLTTKCETANNALSITNSECAIIKQKMAEAEKKLSITEQKLLDALKNIAISNQKITQAENRSRQIDQENTALKAELNKTNLAFQ